MDFITRDHHHHLSAHHHSEFDLPSFEEAFDPESLKNFYRQQNAPISFKRPCSMEEETHSQTFEALSPATTQSQSPMDYYAQYSGETFGQMRKDSHNNVNQTSQGTKTQVQGQLDKKKNKPKKTTEKKETEKKKKVEEPKDPEMNDMISMLFTEIQSFYTEPASTAEQVMATMEHMEQTPKQKSTVKKNRSRKNSKLDNEEDKLSDSVLNKLIKKKSVFIVQRKEVKPVRKNSAKQQGTTKAQRKKSAVTTTTAQTPTESLASTRNDSRSGYFDFNCEMVAQELKEVQVNTEIQQTQPQQVKPTLFQFDLKVNKPEVVKKNNVFANVFSKGKSSALFDDADYLS